MLHNWGLSKDSVAIWMNSNLKPGSILAEIYIFIHKFIVAGTKNKPGLKQTWGSVDSLNPAHMALSTTVFSNLPFQKKL